MFRTIDSPPLDKPTRKQRQRERLTSSDKKRFRRIAGKRCEITGYKDSRKKTKSLHVHHIYPVGGSKSGRKSIDNLALLSPDVHIYLHKIASQIARSHPEKDWGEIVKDLTNSAIEVGKLGRVLNGENPNIVYKRELLIDKLRSQQDMFEA